LEGEVRVDQNENYPTVLDSSSGWVPSGEDTISLEDGVARNFKIPRAGEVILLEKNKIVWIGGKKRTEFES